MLLAIGGTSSDLVLSDLATDVLNGQAPADSLRTRTLASNTVVLIVADDWKTGLGGPTQVSSVCWRNGEVHSQVLFRSKRIAVTGSGEPLRPLFRAGSRFVGELLLTKKTGVEVPLIWNDVGTLSQAMSVLASLVGKEQVLEVAVMTRPSFRVQVTLKPDAARLDVVPWTGVPELDALVHSELPPFDWGTWKVNAYQTPRRTKHKPYISGHAKARIKAIPSRATLADEALLLEALIDPANAGPFFEEVRKSLYASLSWLESPAVEAAFRAAMQFESDGVAKYLATLAWRQKGALRGWAETDLARAWATDSRFAERILAAFREAMFLPQRESLHSAPEPLLSRLSELAKRQGAAF